MSKKIKIETGQELDVGMVNGWRYKVGRTVGGFFYVCRRGVFHGWRMERLSDWDSVPEAVRAAQRHMARCERGVRGWYARRRRLSSTNKWGERWSGSF